MDCGSLVFFSHSRNKSRLLSRIYLFIFGQLAYRRRAPTVEAGAPAVEGLCFLHRTGWRLNCISRTTRVPKTKRDADLLRKKTILVVDDHPATLKLVCGLGHDYNVLGADNGKLALHRSKALKPEIHLLLSDFQMAGMNGIELATRITAQRHGIRALLMSEYPEGMLVLNEGWHFLSKPFIPSQLRALIVGLIGPRHPKLSA